jgi:hypothetical protein
MRFECKERISARHTHTMTTFEGNHIPFSSSLVKNDEGSGLPEIGSFNSIAPCIFWSFWSYFKGPQIDTQTSLVVY